LGGEGIKGGEMGTAIEELGVSFLLGASHGDRAAADDV
jgi:hypothetical protein